MKKLKIVLRNIIMIALVVALTITNGFYSYADTAEENPAETDNKAVNVELGTTYTDSTTPSGIMISSPMAESGGTYIDGTFTGKGSGRNGDITVTVMILDGKISNVDVEQQETPSLWEQAKTIIEIIKSMGNPSASGIDSVDAVSGATLSSDGIKAAMKDALSKALADETIFAGGEGTVQSPYLIANATQLQNFAKAVNGGEPYTSEYIKLSDDINLSATEWTPVGLDEYPFGGFFDGNGKSINNLTIGKSDSYAIVNKAAFFGQLSDGAAVKNLIIDNAKIYTTGETGAKVYGAGLVAASGKNNSIDKCIVRNTEIFVKSDDQQFVYIAGLVGYLDQNSSVTNSLSDCSISGQSGNSVYAGGISGLTGNKTLVMNNRSDGSVEAEVTSGGKTAATAVGGGITGMASGVTYNCYAENTLSVVNNTAASKIYIGALAAWSTANGCVINSCYNSLNTDAEPVVVYPAGSTFFDGIVDIKSKTAQETADMLHNNLSSSSVEAAKALMAEKAPSKDFGFEVNLTGKLFYDWEVSGSKAALSGGIWKERVNPADIFASGTGTEADPYILETEGQIRKFATSLSDENTYEGKFIKLINNIDVSDNNWMPIGEGEYAFCGNFDGSGHVLRGLVVKGEGGTAYAAGSDMYFGLFGVIGKNGLVKNVKIKDIDMNITGKASVVLGGVSGLNDGGTIDSCSVTGSLKAQTTEKGNNYVGGIVGWTVKGYIVNSYTNADVYSSVLPTALAMSGGIAGMTNRSVIANCYSLGKTAGHTKRELETVESMAAVGGLVGVAGSPVVNCYTIGDTASEDYSFYVGATVGWATGIAEVYDIYYSKEANQSIQNEKVSPVSDIGFLVGQGINEEGEVYPGALIYNIEGITAEMAKSQSLADKLNANFDAFPLNTDVLPANIQLKKWIVKDGAVTFSDETSTRTYAAPDVEKPILTGSYYDGTFYGRAENTAENSYVMVTLEVKDKKITSIKSDKEIEGIDSVIRNVIQTNQAPNLEDSDSAAVIGFKNALRRATVKALKGDYTDYTPVDPSIFEGGDGSKDNPYRIANSNQLVKFAAAVNEVEHFKDKFILLANDIDLSGIQWVPAGGRGLYPFSGNFDGKGHTISHMEIGGETEPAKYTCAGLFAYTDTAAISNLKVKDGYIHIQPSSIPGINSERTYAGLLVGYAGLTDTSGTRGTTINNCYVTGQIISSSVESNYVGGLAGMSVHSLLSNSYSNCAIEASSPGNWVYTGGLVGLPAFSLLVNNIAYGKVYSDSAVNKTQIGGIGGMYSSYAFNNYTDVDLTTEKQTADIGGIAGRITGIGYISDCFGSMTAGQKTGNKVLTGINTVGTIISGDRYGKGQIQKSELAASVDQNLINVLNKNAGLIGKDNMYADLVGEWSVYIPENLKYNTWALNNGKIAFAAEQTDNSGGNTGGSSSSGGQAGSPADHKVKAVESQGSASATVKVNDIRESKSLEVESSLANIVFDENALKEIITKAYTELSVNINILEKSLLPQNLKNIVGDRPVYDITLKSGDKIISDLGSGTVSVEIPYTLRKGEDPAGIIVYYMDDQGKLTKMATSYDSGTKKVTFKTNHFSRYIVGYDAATATHNQFTDVSENVWYAEAVQYVFDRGIMNGESDTAFGPNASSTRATVCTILWNMEKKPAQTVESGFKDVLNDSWYAQAVIWANEQGVTKGTGENSFAPNSNVTREQFAQFLYNYAKYKGYNVEQATDLSKYKDMPSAWAEDAVKWAVNNGIISGKGNGMLDLQGIATRAEMAQMIMNFNKKYSMQ